MYRSIYIKASLFACALAGFVFLLFLLESGPAPATAQASSLSALSSKTQVAAAANPLAQCGPEWHGTAGTGSPFGEYPVQFFGVSAISGNDIWGVGLYHYESSYATMTQHWDGGFWYLVPSPTLGAYSTLTGVSAISNNDVWAVGYATSDTTGDTMLMEHWDGTSWTLVPPVTSSGRLNAVSAISSNDVWAVGTNTSGTIIEHWNGTTWISVAHPSPAPNSSLLGIEAISANNVWAVGRYNSNGIWFTLIEHWNGTLWSLISSPNIDGYNNYLNGVSAISSNDIWAVGVSYDPAHSDPEISALIEHWNGSAWTIVPSPSIGPYNPLQSVSAISSNDIWAVGFAEDINSPGDTTTLIEHWNGSTWSVVPSPNFSPRNNELYGVASISGNNVWALGTTNGHVLYEHYTLVDCDPTPTITPTLPPRCPGERFTDVCPGDYFYQHVLALNDLGILLGYNAESHCGGAAYTPCFQPYNWTTRGQIAKIVSLSAGFNDPVSGQTFEDVPTDHTFYQYIERMYALGAIGGYPCGGTDEPCDSTNRPYFRPGNRVSRGQISKMVALAFGIDTNVITQTFEDVTPSHTFYPYIERLALLGIIQGYPCGSTSEPCSPSNRPYFRPANVISRGQISKIVNLARTQLVTPTPTFTPTATPVAPTPTHTATPQPSETSTPIATQTLIATGTPTTTPTP